MTWDTSELKDKGLQVLRGFFPEALQSDLTERAETVKSGVAAGTFARNAQFALGLPDAWFDPISKNPELIALVSNLLGPDLCLSTWRVLMKDAHFNGPISIHQDWAYFGGGVEKINVFVPLTRVHRGNGAMVFYEQSHQFGPVERGSIEVSRYPYLTAACPELEVGDILLADFLTWHSSVPAETSEERIMLQLVYQPSSDPSSKNLIAGQMRNRRNLPNRLEPLAEPLTQVSCLVAREFLKAGDSVRAERYAAGALASDPNHAEAALLLYDLQLARGDPHAGQYLERARDALARLNADLAARDPTATTMTVRPSADPSPLAGGWLARTLSRLRQTA